MSSLHLVGDAERIIKMIVNTFETGEPEGNYGLAVLLQDGAGISYGRSQATDRGGNLDAIVYGSRPTTPHGSTPRGRRSG